MTDEYYNRILKEKLDVFKNEKDPVKEMVKWLLKELMEVEVDGLTGQKKGITIVSEKTFAAAIGSVNLEGKREILAIEPMENESEETYKIVFDKLKQRGVEKVWLCISDAHKGLKAAITKCWQGSSWQRCKVHFKRNILAHVNTKNKNEVAGKLKLIWQAPDVQTSIKL